MIWIAPTGHTYTTYPGANSCSPHCANRRPLWAGDLPSVESTGDRGVMMPKRRHTRADYTAKTIAAERRLNDVHVAKRNQPPPF